MKPLKFYSWLRTSQAALFLGMSPETLLRKRREGDFSPGLHWISIGKGSTSPILWNIEACRSKQCDWSTHHGDIR